MFSLIPSVFLKQSYAVLMTCGLVFVWCLPAALVLKLMITLSIAVTGSSIYRKYVMNLEFVKLKKLNKENWLLQTMAGDIFQGELQGDSVVNSIFSIIILKSNDTKQTKKLLIGRDMLSAKHYHRLTLELRGLL